MTISTLPRPYVGALALLMIALILALDMARNGAPALFNAPPAIALGSGQAPTGAHCTAR